MEEIISFCLGMISTIVNVAVAIWVINALKK